MSALKKLLNEYQREIPQQLGGESSYDGIRKEFIDEMMTTVLILDHLKATDDTGKEVKNLQRLYGILYKWNNFIGGRKVANQYRNTHRRYILKRIAK
jgi:hypothetical protein